MMQGEREHYIWMSQNFRHAFRAGALVFVAAFALAAFSQKSHGHKSQQPASQVAPPPPVKEIVHRAMQRDIANWEQEKNYTFIQRIEQRELNSDGSVKSNKSETEEIIFLYDQPYAHLIKRNDQQLADAEARKVEKKLNDTMEKRRSEGPSERQKRLADFSKHHREEHEFLLEVPEAYDFRIVGEETLNGRAAYVISGEPRPVFRPNLNAARVLPKLRPKLWIDKAEFQWLRMDADVIDTITWGGFLLRLHPGSHIEIEQTLVNNEVWLPLHAHIGFDARVALVKPIRLDIDAVFSNYKKFRTESKIISVEEVQHQ